jgi:hypothetical protein
MWANCGHLRSFDYLVFDSGLSNLSNLTTHQIAEVI